MRRDWSAAYAGEMSGSMPEPEGTTASTGICVDRQPRVVRPLELQDRLRVRCDQLGEAGFVGPRFEKVVPPAL